MHYRRDHHGLRRHRHRHHHQWHATDNVSIINYPGYTLSFLQSFFCRLFLYSWACHSGPFTSEFDFFALRISSFLIILALRLYRTEFHFQRRLWSVPNWSWIFESDTEFGLFWWFFLRFKSIRVRFMLRIGCNVDNVLSQWLRYNGKKRQPNSTSKSGR